MIKAVDINEIPNIIRRGETCYDIEQFLDSDMNCCEIEVNDSGRETIVVTEIPYMVNKREMIEKIAELVETKKVDGIAYINDETTMKGVRIVIRLKKDANSNVVLNTLFKYTPLQSSFSVNNVALVNGRPRTLNLKQLIKYFVKHRHEVILRRTKFDLEKAQKRAHILEGLLKALDIIDEIIALIKASNSAEDARKGLIEKFDFSEAQAAAIVEMRLRSLVGLEIEKLQNEYDELMKFIKYCEDVLANVDLQMGIIKDETLEMKEKYGDARRTEIALSAEEFNPEDFYADEDVVITISHLGYIKRTSLTEYRTQNRGGVGMKGSATRDEDFIEHIYVAKMHNTMLFFTSKGRCYKLKVYELPEGNKASKGRAIQNMLNIEPGDAVRACLCIRKLNDPEFCQSHYVVFCTKSGIVKKTCLKQYSRPRSNGLIAINLMEGDSLVDVRLTNGRNELIIASRKGRAVRFDENDVRPTGRTSMGVIGMNLADRDEVVGMQMESQGDCLMIVSEKGLGKCTLTTEFTPQNRGGKGVKTINITEKTGKLVAIKTVKDENDLMIINKSGIAIRFDVSSIRVMGRATQGVRLINLDKREDEIASVCKVEKSEEEETVQVVSEELSEAQENFEQLGESLENNNEQ